MVVYLKKLEGSEGFHQIVDFLNASHIRYALTANPTIYVSLMKQFWETATAKTLDYREIELTTTIDGKVKIVTDASIRRHLQLADSDGISSLPTTEIFKQLSLMGCKIWEGLPLLLTWLRKRSWPVSGRKIDEIYQDPIISLVQHDAEIQGRYGHDMDFDFDFDTAKEVSTAEKDVSTAEPVSTTGAAVTTASVAAVSTASPTRRVSTADDITMAETLVYIRKSAAKDKGKGKMDESEPVQTKTKLQQEQERLGYEAAVRLQDELKEEKRQRIARVCEAASSFNVEEWEDIQARVEVDEELAQRLQAEEREIYTKAEQARMLVELINQRKRYFAP
ncbi:hypothetical protein Tco_0988998 [Tanacetum coccineum]|uniref:Xylulose kinase-1 n=1 Tax=Tanacetum coccineum TaxID=301880 RepID=A0ABQ5ESL2_9ASTR